MQTQGSLSEGGLGALLETMQAERATGTLFIQDGSGSCSLYFLFGHLFHASGPTGQGEEVVVDALTWHDGTFQFDPRAKLPAEETIKSSPAELIAAAQSRSTVTAGPVPADSSYFAPVVADHPAFETYAPAPVPAAVSAGAPAGDADSGLASWAATQEPGDEPVAYPAAEEPAESAAPEPVPFPIAAEPEPMIRLERSRPLGSQEAYDAAVYYPLPSGRSHYEGLKSAFVDFPRLLRTLGSDQHTGYVRLTGVGSTYGGFILFRDGATVEVLCSNSTVTQGEAAFVQFRRHMENGDGVIDVVELDGEVVDALARLYAGAPLFVGLLGRFVDIDALLEYLEEQKLDGSVIVATPDNLGVILLTKGSVLGAYTETSRDLDKGADPGSALAHDKSSRIEVKSAPTQVQAVDVEGALALPY